jgi:hypothetical protein
MRVRLPPVSSLPLELGVSMYLFLFANGCVRQVHDNLSIADMLAIKDKTLRVYTIHDDTFMLVTIDEEKVCFVPVPESRIVQCQTGRLHHT